MNGGVNLDYQQHYLNKDIWNIREASWILIGLDPDSAPFSEDDDYEYQCNCYEAERMAALLKASAKLRRLKPCCVLFEYHDGNEYGYEPEVIIEWAIKKKMDIPKPLTAWYLENTTHNNTQTHTSELLDMMNHCIAEFWENHDPENPPKNLEILAWLQSQDPELSISECKAICTVMRPKQYK